MGWWQVNADTLAAGRFVVSPLAEATASILTLQRATAAHPGERAWLDAHLPAYQQLLAADPIASALIRAAGCAPRRHWIADFFTPTPTGEPGRSFEQELRPILDTPPATAREDLEVALGGPLPVLLQREDLPERTAGLLTWVWREAVLPYWPRRRRILEADIVARAEQLSQGGWSATLDDMRPGMRWLGENRLQINIYDNPPRDLSSAQLLFVPVTPRQGWVSTWEAQERYVLVYPCSGPLAEPDRGGAPAALGALLGPARAGVLLLLGTPKNTTQLVALTGQGLGSVGRHLRVLLDARLIGRRRAGRSVLYFRTPAGETLVEAQLHLSTEG